MSILSSSKAGKASIKINEEWLIKYGFVKTPYEAKYKYHGRDFQYLNYSRWLSDVELIEKYNFNLHTSNGVLYYIELKTLEDLELLISFFEAQDKKQKNTIQSIHDKLIKKASYTERPTEMFNWTKENYQRSVSSMSNAIAEKVNKRLCEEIDKRYKVCQY